MLNFDLPLQTKNGREVEIWRRDAGGMYPILGAIRTEQGTLEPARWTVNGHTDDDNASNFLEYKKERIEFTEYANIYKDTNSERILTPDKRFKSREDAEDNHQENLEEIKKKGLKRIACIEIAINAAEGDGLKDYF